MKSSVYVMSFLIKRPWVVIHMVLFQFRVRLYVKYSRREGKTSEYQNADVCWSAFVSKHLCT